jgi:hypothetical protein
VCPPRALQIVVSKRHFAFFFIYFCYCIQHEKRDSVPPPSPYGFMTHKGSTAQSAGMSGWGGGGVVGGHLPAFGSSTSVMVCAMVLLFQKSLIHGAPCACMQNCHIYLGMIPIYYINVGRNTIQSKMPPRPGRKQVFYSSFLKTKTILSLNQTNFFKDNSIY